MNSILFILVVCTLALVAVADVETLDFDRDFIMKKTREGVKGTAKFEIEARRGSKTAAARTTRTGPKGPRFRDASSIDIKDKKPESAIEDKKSEKKSEKKSDMQSEEFLVDSLRGLMKMKTKAGASKAGGEIKKMPEDEDINLSSEPADPADAADVATIIPAAKGGGKAGGKGAGKSPKMRMRTLKAHGKHGKGHHGKGHHGGKLRTLKGKVNNMPSETAETAETAENADNADTADDAEDIPIITPAFKGKAGKGGKHDPKAFEERALKGGKGGKGGKHGPKEFEERALKAGKGGKGGKHGPKEFEERALKGGKGGKGGKGKMFAASAERSLKAGAGGGGKGGGGKGGGGKGGKAGKAKGFFFGPKESTFSATVHMMAEAVGLA